MELIHKNTHTHKNQNITGHMNSDDYNKTKN